MLWSCYDQWTWEYRFIGSWVVWAAHWETTASSLCVTMSSKTHIADSFVFVYLLHCLSIWIPVSDCWEKHCGDYVWENRQWNMLQRGSRGIHQSLEIKELRFRWLSVFSSVQSLGLCIGMRTCYPCSRFPSPCGWNGPKERQEPIHLVSRFARGIGSNNCLRGQVTCKTAGQGSLHPLSVPSWLVILSHFHHWHLRVSESHFIWDHPLQPYHHGWPCQELTPDCIPLQVIGAQKVLHHDKEAIWGKLQHEISASMHVMLGEMVC